MSSYIIIFLSLVELTLLAIVVTFFSRLKKSEALISHLQANQESFINKLHFNAQLEHEMVQSFSQRQQELGSIVHNLEAKQQELERLIKKAEEYSSSPLFLRNVILSGHRKGRSIQQLVQDTGLSRDEVELILEQS